MDTANVGQTINNQDQTPVIISHPKKSTSFLWFVLGIMVTLVFVGIGYLVYIKSFDKPVSLLPSPDAQINPTPDPTSDWKTYTSKINKIEFRYPLTYSIKEWEPIEDIKFSLSIFPINKQNVSRGGEIAITLWDNSNKLTIDEWISNHPEKYINVKPQSTTTVSGKSVRIIEADGMGLHDTSRIALFENENLIITLTSSATESIAYNLMNQILSTFKFLDETIDTSSWKTYTNNQYNFSFKYPLTWKDITDLGTINNGNREFRLQTNNNEYINGTVFDEFDTAFIDQTWSKQIEIGNNKSILITYTDDIGPGSQGGIKDIKIFDQILSTFKFL